MLHLGRRGAGAYGVPVGCNPTNPMRESLQGGTYALHLGGATPSMVSLPLLPHGALPTARAEISPTGEVDPGAALLGFSEWPLPIDW